MSLAGIDISAYQATTPSLANLDFVVCRATYGTKTDAMYATHSAAVRAAGLFLGAYHFAYTGSVVPIADQAAAFLAVAKDADFLAIDVEGASQPTDAELRDLIARIHAAGRTVGIYHSLSGFPSVGQDWNWVAYWGRLAPPIAWAFWQSSGAPLDHDWFNGDGAALGRLAGLTPPDSSTGGDVDPKTAIPIAVADFRSGGTLYDDLASTSTALPVWQGGTSVGVYARATRADGMAMDLIRVDFSTGGADLRAVWTGEDHASNFRIPDAIDGTPYGSADLKTARVAGFNDGRAAVISAAMNVPPAK